MNYDKAIAAMQNIVGCWMRSPGEVEAAKLAIKAIKALRDGRQGEALTMEDVKLFGARCGLPVWLEIIPDNLWQSRWVLIGTAVQTQDGTDVGIELGAFGNSAVFKFEDYGTTWLAYRTRPQGEEHTRNTR